MQFKELEIKGCFEITPLPIVDNRGWFARVYCEEEFKKFNLKGNFVQFNQSFNSKKGTVRGLHFQKTPFKEEKLIRCVSGRVCDIIVDLRLNSPTFLQSIFVELSSLNNNLIYLPAGIAHGFQTLEDNCTLLYHHTQFYNKEADAGVSIFDPMLNIKLPLEVTVISEKDSNYPLIIEDFKGI